MSLTANPINGFHSLVLTSHMWGSQYGGKCSSSSRGQQSEKGWELLGVGVTLSSRFPRKYHIRSGANLKWCLCCNMSCSSQRTLFGRRCQIIKPLNRLSAVRIGNCLLLFICICPSACPFVGSFVCSFVCPSVGLLVCPSASASVRSPVHTFYIARIAVIRPQL